jgi:hypothetical protein
MNPKQTIAWGSVASLRLLAERQGCRGDGGAALPSVLQIDYAASSSKA